MIYGERERAFSRLQEQIISKSTDESIFVWDLDFLEDATRDAKDVQCGLLATSPACFARCDDVTSTGRSRGFCINQFSLSISLPATLYVLGTYQAPLHVTKAKTAGHCAILLAKLPEGGSFARTRSLSGKSVLLTEARAVKLMEFSISLQPPESHRVSILASGCGSSGSTTHISMLTRYWKGDTQQTKTVSSYRTVRSARLESSDLAYGMVVNLLDSDGSNWDSILLVIQFAS